MIRAAGGFVRAIVRRPHAYFFIADHTEERGGIGTATPSGVTLRDGSAAPLPGIYILDADGVILASVDLLDADARDHLLEILEDTGS